MTQNNSLYKPNSFEVIELINPTQHDLQAVGRIMMFLSDTPMDETIGALNVLRAVSSTDTAQFVAKITNDQDTELRELRANYPIVGAATVSTLNGVLGQKAWLEDFVVLPDVRQYGVAQMIWDTMSAWRTERGLTQMRFNSTPDRARAHGFYKRNGCAVLAEGKTTLFVHNLK